MLYIILRFIVKIALKIFFKTIQIRNAEFVPSNVPLIIASNHPSSFMDPLVIGSYIKQPLFYIARGVLFTKPLRRWFLSKLHMIPIYRKHENPELVEKNEEIFRECSRLLTNKGAILIFPEGISKKKRRLHKIKTGTARIALGAEASNDFKLGVALVPVGLNFSDVGIFRSELFINFAKPIDIAQFFDMYKRNEYDAVRALTDQIKNSLEQHTIAIENETLDGLVKNIETVYKSELSAEFGLSLKQKQDEFLLTKGIAEAVHHFYRENPYEVETFRIKIQRYLHNLQRLNLKDSLIKKSVLRRSLSVDSFKTLLFTVFGFPIYLYGIINNYLPYRIPGVLAEKMYKSTEYQGPMKLVFGIITFSAFYTGQILFVVTVFNTLWLTILYAATLPFFGFFALNYWGRIKRVRHNIFFIALFYRRNFLVSKLIQQRLEIIKALEKAKQDYMQFQKEHPGE